MAGPLISPLVASSGALVSSLLIKASPGRLLRLGAVNTNAATRYVQLFDAVALPSNGAVPRAVYPLATGAALPSDWVTQFHGDVFAIGIVVANSTTLATLTLGGADHWFDASFS